MQENLQPLDLGIIEYENILLKKANSFSTHFTKKNITEKEVIPVFRYVFESLLNWGPFEVRDRVTYDLICFLHLQRLFKKINLPNGLNPETDTFFLACVLYPKTIHYTLKDLTLYIYEKKLHGKSMKLPKDFFSESDGHFKAAICLQHAICKRTFNSKKEMYLFFGNKPEALKFLKQYRLYGYFQSNYEYPVDYLHNSLPDEEKNDYYYHLARFYSEFDQFYQKRRGRNED